MSPGPMLAVTISKSSASPWAGAHIALGHAVVEVPLIALIALGLSPFLENPPLRLGLSLIGGGVIVWMGLGLLRSQIRRTATGASQRSAFAAGIITSGLNPFFFAWWATAGGLLILNLVPYGWIGVASFTLVHWLTDLAYLCLVSVLVYKTHSLWNPNLERGIFALCGLILIGFGVWFILNGVNILI